MRTDLALNDSNREGVDRLPPLRQRIPFDYAPTLHAGPRASLCPGEWRDAVRREK
jgi:hypothetical protein